MTGLYAIAFAGLLSGLMGWLFYTEGKRREARLCWFEACLFAAYVLLSALEALFS